MVNANFLPDDEITYIPNAHVEKNPYITREMETGELPTYDGSRHLLPKPYWQGHEDTIACHDKAWQIAFGNLRKPVKESGFKSSFIDTAFNGQLFMWDSAQRGEVRRGLLGDAGGGCAGGAPGALRRSPGQ